MNKFADSLHSERISKVGDYTQEASKFSPTSISWNKDSIDNGKWTLEELRAARDVYDSLDLSDSAAIRRNRGNYRCSKCGEPKKGHICSYQPLNFKCNRCGNPKKFCSCVAPLFISSSAQVEMDEHMTVRVLNVSEQGTSDFHLCVSDIIDRGSYQLSLQSPSVESRTLE